MVLSKWAQQQAALANSAAPAEVASVRPVKAERQSPSPTKPRGRPKTRLSTIDELAEYLQVSRSTIYRLIETKQLPHLRIGFILRFDIPTVLRWAQNFTDRGDQLTWQDDQAELKRLR